MGYGGIAELYGKGNLYGVGARAAESRDSRNTCKIQTFGIMKLVISAHEANLLFIIELRDEIVRGGEG
jgi:hypothetical protein